MCVQHSGAVQLLSDAVALIGIPKQAADHPQPAASAADTVKITSATATYRLRPLSSLSTDTKLWCVLKVSASVCMQYK